MKSAKILMSFVLLSFLFIGCENDEDNTNAEFLTGLWVNTMVNNQNILTDAAFVMEFKTDNTEMYATGIHENENNKYWQENASYTYSVSGDRISIEGSDTQGNSYQMEFEIQSLDQETIVYTVPTFSINGDDIPDNDTYTCQRITEDFSAEFVGVWYGHCTTAGTMDSLYHYWEYFDNGSYNYYYQDENSNWIKKSDNEGRYFLYGSLMATNYSNDLLSGATGLAYECWNFTIDGDNMLWTGLRENNVTINYEMVKVAAAPICH
jgi:hypothetical protein